MKTSELQGVALDWAVAKCEEIIQGNDLNIGFIREGGYAPSRYWNQGGPIIERERIDLYFVGHDAVDNALPIWRAEKLGTWGEEGFDPLIAAMRCYVASKLGNDVEIPNELTTGESK